MINIDSHNIFIIHKVCTWSYRILLLVQAYLFFLVVDKGGKIFLKNRLNRYWTILSTNKIISLPFRVIEVYLKISRSVFIKNKEQNNWLHQIEDNYNLVSGILIIYFILIGFYSLTTESAVSRVVLIEFMERPYLIIGMLIFAPIFLFDRELSPITFTIIFFLIFIDTIFILPFLLTIFLFAIVIIWFYAFDFESYSLEFFNNRRNVFIFLLIALILTYLSFFIGHNLNPGMFIPRTLRAILINLLFDVATFLTTHFLLVWAIKRGKTGKVIFAIFLDILLASAYSILSLYLALKTTAYEVDFVQSYRVFIGLNTNGTSLEFSPLFWFMHSSLIPTIIYISIILFSLFTRVTINIVLKIFKKAAIHEKPEQWLFALLGLIIACLFLFSEITSDIYEKKSSNEINITANLKH